MAAIFQMTFSNAFFWLKMFTISLKFVPKGPINKLTSSIGLDNGLAPTRRQAIIWINDG